MTRRRIEERNTLSHPELQYQGHECANASPLVRPQVPQSPASKCLSESTLGLLLPVLAVSITVSGPAAAQDAREGEVELAPTVVTGQHDRLNVSQGSAATLTAPLLNTPRTVRVITRREIEERGATSVEDILRTTPGVTLGSGEGGTPFGMRPYIRGFEAAFSIAVDGVRTRGRTTYESFNIENIEINMGSDGVTSGAGSAGGSISLNSKEPRMGERFNDLSVMFGNASQQRATYDGNFSFSDDVSGRLNLLWQDSGVPGSKHVEDNKEGIAPSIAWNIDGGNKLTFKFQHVKSTGRPGARVPFANAAYNANSHIPGWADYGSGTPGDPYLPLENIDRDNYYGVLGRDFREANNSSAHLKFEHAFANDFLLTSGLSWIETDVKMAIMRPAVTIANGQFMVARNGNGGYRASNRDTETATFNTNVRGEFNFGGFEHSVSFGVEVARDRVRNGSSTTTVTTPNQTSLFNPDPFSPFTTTGSFGPLGTPVKTDTEALYAFDTVKLNDRWMVNGGVRIEDFEIDDGAQRWGDTLTDYQIGIMFKPIANATIYASLNTTSSPPGACANQGGGNCPSESLNEFTTSTKAEQTRNTELGIKWDSSGGDLSLNAAIYNTEKDNARIADEDGNYTLNAGNHRGRGFDLGVAGQINRRWAATAGYTYLDAEQTDNDTSNTPINTAKHTFSFWTTYAISDKITLGGGANHVSRKYVNPENTYAVPAYWRADAMASYRLNPKTSVQFNVTNLFDERYYDSSHVGSFATIQPGRSLTARLNYSF